MPQRAAVLAFGVSVEQMSSGRLAADQTPFAPQALIESVQLMRMRQSIAQLERAFVEESFLEVLFPFLEVDVIERRTFGPLGD